MAARVADAADRLPADDHGDLAAVREACERIASAAADVDAHPELAADLERLAEHVDDIPFDRHGGDAPWVVLAAQNLLTVARHWLAGRDVDGDPFHKQLAAVRGPLHQLGDDAPS